MSPTFDWGSWVRSFETVCISFCSWSSASWDSQIIFFQSFLFSTLCSDTFSTFGSGQASCLIHTHEIRTSTKRLVKNTKDACIVDPRVPYWFHRNIIVISSFSLLLSMNIISFSSHQLSRSTCMHNSEGHRNSVQVGFRPTRRQTGVVPGCYRRKRLEHSSGLI